MTVKITPVTRDDLPHLFKLKVTDEQNKFVAPNEFTLAQAPYETGAYVFTIWSDDTRVGMLAVLDMAEHKYLEPDDDPQSGYIWRLLIGKEFQGQGFGTAAIECACEWAKERGKPTMSIQVVTHNAAALRLYQNVGFVSTGKITEGELMLIRQL